MQKKKIPLETEKIQTIYDILNRAGCAFITPKPKEKVATPILTPKGGELELGETFNLICDTDGVTFDITYINEDKNDTRHFEIKPISMNGKSVLQYKAPEESGKCKIKIFAKKEGYLNSDSIEENYVFLEPDDFIVYFDPDINEAFENTFDMDYPIRLYTKRKHTIKYYYEVFKDYNTVQTVDDWIFDENLIIKTYTEPIALIGQTPETKDIFGEWKAGLVAKIEDRDTLFKRICNYLLPHID